MNERDIQVAIQLEASKAGHRLMRNNVGMLRDINGTPVRFGLGIGSSDLIGWTSSGAFLAIEVKYKTAATEAQLAFIAAVLAAGGKAGIAHNIDEARAIWGSDVNAR
jgi:hypothetical protein